MQQKLIQLYWERFLRKLIEIEYKIISIQIALLFIYYPIEYKLTIYIAIYVLKVFDRCLYQL